MDIESEYEDVENDVIKNAFRNLDKTFAKTKEYRQEIVDKLRDKLDSFLPSSEDSATLLASKASTISSYVSILNDIDKQSVSKVNILLKNKEQEDNIEATKNIVTAFLASGKTLDLQKPLPYSEGARILDDADKALDKLCDEGVLEISEAQLRVDPTDLS